MKIIYNTKILEMQPISTLAVDAVEVSLSSVFQ